MNPSSFFGLSDHLEALSKHGDPLEVLEATVDFEYFRGWLVEGLGYGDGAKGGRPPFDPVWDCQIFCVWGLLASLIDEPFTEQDGELGFGHEPFSWRAFPTVGGLVQHQI